MSRRVTARIAAAEARLKAAPKPTYPEEASQAANIDAHSSGAQFDVPAAKPKKKAKPKE